MKIPKYLIPLQGLSIFNFQSILGPDFMKCFTKVRFLRSYSWVFIVNGKNKLSNEIFGLESEKKFDGFVMPEID